MRFVRSRFGSQKFVEAMARGALCIRSVMGGRNYRKFVIIGTARTGSTLLLSLLNAHRNVIAFGELFRGDGRVGWDIAPFLSRQSPQLNRLLDARPLAFLDSKVFRKWPRGIDAVGFKLFYYHAREGAQVAVWDYIRNDPEIVVIHLKRLNILEQYLSLKVAEVTNVWSISSRRPTAAAPIRLNPHDCQKHFEEVRAFEDSCDSFFAGRQLEEVTYEELVANRSDVMRRICARLGLFTDTLEAGIIRQRTQPLVHAIANYEELCAHFTGSIWEDFFRQRDITLVGQRVS